MKKFRYIYQNSSSLSKLEKDGTYEGERVLYKAEEIKYEDEKLNKKYNIFFYITSFRLLMFEDGIIFDVPLPYITNHYVKKPVFYGSNYIYFELETKPLTKIPTYIKENLSPEEMGGSYELPKWGMIKYRTGNYNIDEGYNILLHALKAQEWTISFLQKRLMSNSVYVSGSGGILGNISSQSQIQIDQTSMSMSVNSVPAHHGTVVDSSGGIGLARTTNMIKNRINENKETITKSFSDINLIKTNGQKLIEIASQLRAKIMNDSNATQKNDINSILQNIGFIDPVTKETSGKEYYVQLSRQISDYLSEYLKNTVGLISLIDAYCIYNRARGINTISPKDMKSAVDLVSTIPGSKILVKRFKNEMTIIHTNDYTTQSLFNKISSYSGFQTNAYITLKEFVELTHINNAVLSKLLLDELLETGLLCLDESVSEVRYYRNMILRR